MSRDDKKLIGFLIGREKDLPDALMDIINSERSDMRAELVKLSGTFQGEPVDYDVIVDRMSHEIPYYRIYAKYACLHGCYLINNPFTWGADTKFFGANVIAMLGFKSPKTLVLPNKDVETDTVPDSFRNLDYPMDWPGIIDHVGALGIFKDVRSGGRRFAYRVQTVEELIQRYDESGTRTMILQQVMDSNRHFHCIVIGGEKTLLLPYSLADAKYTDDPLDVDSPLGREMMAAALQLTIIYGYDINMVEFVIDNDEVYVINATNPSPLVSRELMTDAQFDWIARAVADLAIERALHPKLQPLPVNLPDQLRRASSRG